MSTSYFMNIGAYVATVIFAAARLAVGGVLTEPGALVPALLVLGILLIPLASKGGFQKSTYQTGPAFGLAWGVLYALTPAQLSSDRISGVLEASLDGLSFSFKDNLAVFCIGLLLLVGLSAVRKYFPNAALNVLRYAILTLMQLLAFEGMFRYLLDAQSARQLWLFVPPVLFSGLFLARELRDGEEKSRLRICVLASVLYAFLTCCPGCGILRMERPLLPRGKAYASGLAYGGRGGAAGCADAGKRRAKAKYISGGPASGMGGLHPAAELARRRHAAGRG